MRLPQDATIRAMDIRHCVIPAAGLGTRFLPATRALPKELLPVLNRPAIQWGVEEALAAGAQEMVVVISRGKELIQQHFAPHPELESVLEARGKSEDLEAVRATGRMAEFTWVYQPEPRGLGDAVLCAENAVGDNPFMCLLPDDLSYAPVPVMRQLKDAFDKLQVPILALMRATPEQISRFGCATVVESRGRLHRISKLVEKPPLGQAESDLAVMGRYVLTPAIFDSLRRTQPGAGGEIQLTDAIAGLLESGDVWGVEFEGSLLDVGTPEGWLQTNVLLAHESPQWSLQLPQAVA